ncbi:MAG: OB-fold domain-containing protein [Sphingobium sp.]
MAGERVTEEVGNVRILPGLDALNRPYWTGGAEGQLLITRCTSCARYQHPPGPDCPVCRAAAEPVPVSGRGRIKSFTINRQKWLPDMATPFVFAAVEIEEQAGLYLCTNIVGCPVEQVDFDMAVEVCFLEQEDVFLPMFRPSSAVGREDAA